jgi:hypothetical protein
MEAAPGHCGDVQVKPIAFGMSVNRNLQSQSHSCLFNRTWQTRLKELEHRLKFKIQLEEMPVSPQMDLVTSPGPEAL